MQFYGLMAMMVMILAGAADVSAQTLYNNPGQASTEKPSVISPLNLRQLFRRDQKEKAPTQQVIPYSSQSTDQSDFAKRYALLSQWKAEQDANAQLAQANGQEYMRGLAAAPEPRIYGVTPTMGPSSYPATGSAEATAPYQGNPVIYRKKEDEKIDKPRRLFNLFD